MDLDQETLIWITHVDYELNTLAELPKWVELTGSEGPAIVNVSCVEATLIHGRLLIEFLVGRPREDGSRGRHRKDVQPGDFLPGWAHPNPSTFDRHLANIDPYLSHLSKARSDGTTAPAGYLTDLVDDVMAAMEVFVKDLREADSPYAGQFQATLNVAKIRRARGPASWPPEGWDA